MKRAAALLLTMAMAFSCALAFAQQEDTQITVQGSAQVSAEPDIGVVTANASVLEETVSGAQTRIGAIVDAACTALEALGVAKEDIVTQNYSYYPSYNHDAEVPQIVGYQANHTLEITCRDPQMLDSVIAAITDCGMSEIYNVTFDVSNREELYLQALCDAIDSAQMKAAHMAACGGMTLTGLISLDEGGSYVPNGGMLTYARKDAAAGTGIRSGSVSVSASVTAVYGAVK